MFLGIDWGRIVSYEFWIQVRPGGFSEKFEVVFIGILVLAYALYAFSLWMQKKEMRDAHRLFLLFWKKFSNFSLTMAITYTFIFFFRYEGIPYLGSRIWFGFWFLALVIWFGYLLRYYYVFIPKLMAEQAIRAQKNKYLK